MHVFSQFQYTSAVIVWILDSVQNKRALGPRGGGKRLLRSHFHSACSDRSVTWKLLWVFGSVHENCLLNKHSFPSLLFGYLHFHWDVFHVFPNRYGIHWIYLFSCESELVSFAGSGHRHTNSRSSRNKLAFLLGFRLKSGGVKRGRHVSQQKHRIWALWGAREVEPDTEDQHRLRVSIRVPELRSGPKPGTQRSLLLLPHAHAPVLDVREESSESALLPQRGQILQRVGVRRVERPVPVFGCAAHGADAVPVGQRQPAARSPDFVHAGREQEGDQPRWVSGRWAPLTTY